MIDFSFDILLSSLVENSNISKVITSALFIMYAHYAQFFLYLITFG